MLLRINKDYKGIHEVRILTSDVGLEQFPIYKMNLNYPKPLRFLDIFFRGLAFYRGIRRIMKEYEFDVLLFGDAMAGIIPKFLLGKKVIVWGMINDYITASVTWNNFFKIYGGKGLLLQKQFEKFSTHFLDRIIVCSNFLKQYLCTTYHCSDDKVFRLYQGIDVESINFEPKRKCKNGTVNILFVKYLFYYGGLHFLLRALKLIDSYNFQVTIYGPNKKYKDRILEMFSGLSHVKVDFYGFGAQEVIYKKMRSNHILCVPSTLESFGLTNVEGLAHGINVVTTLEGGIPEVLNDGNNGWLCEAGNPKALAYAIRKCIEATPEERIDKQINGRKFVEKHFDIKVSTEKLLAILESCAIDND